MPVDVAIAALVAGTPRRVDAGRNVYRRRDGSRGESYFLNTAGFGISGLVDEYVDAVPAFFGGTGGFLIGTLRAFAVYRPAPVSLAVDGNLLGSNRIVLVAAANGSYYAGGMRLAPEASLDDGLLEVVAVGALSRGAP